MLVLGAIVGLLIGGFIVGGLARFVLPGPDPMPIWTTIAIGVGGSLVGGLAAGAVSRRCVPRRARAASRGA